MKKTFSILLFIILIALIAVSLYITRETGTQPIWEKQYGFRVFSDPIYAEERCYFIGGDKGRNKHFVYEIDEQGNITAQSTQLPATPYEPIYSGNKLIISDMSNVIRAFSVPKLNVIWEKTSEKHLRLKLVKLDEKRILAIYNDTIGKKAGSENYIYCINSADGAVIWQNRISSPISKIAHDGLIVCIRTSTDMFSSNNSSYCATAIDIETGDIEWEIENIDDIAPLVIENICILSATQGRTIIVDGISGEVKFTNPETGYEPISIKSSHFIALKESEKKLTVTSLETGNAWNTTLTRQFKDCAIQGNNLIIADKMNVQSHDIETGLLNWKMDLKDIYNLYAYRNGIFTTHKDSFTSRKTYGRFINIQTKKAIWYIIDSNVFMKPVQFRNGDFVITSNGYARLMPNMKEADSSIDDQFTFKIQKKQPFSKTNKTPDNKVSEKELPEKTIPKNDLNFNLDFPEIKFNNDQKEKNTPQKQNKELSDLERKTEW